jgi:hypothetical protein
MGQVPLYHPGVSPEQGPVLAAAFLALASVAMLACRPDPRVEERVVTLHTPRACALEPARAFAQLYPAGDFEPGAIGAFEALFLREKGRALASFPVDTRALLVDASEGQGARRWRGIVPVRPGGAVDVLAWPAGEACRLTADVERRQATAIGAIDERRVLVVGGRSASGASIPRSYLADMTTGDVLPLRFGVASPRDRPTITPFGKAADGLAAGALVAGGRVPDTGTPLDTAEVFVATAAGGDFVAEKIAIEPRADHAAVVLRTGETLLVGGAGRDGLLRAMQIVDPASRRAISQGVATLRVPRRSPTAIRLASGEILVGGGTDADGRAVATIEFFRADASAPAKREIELKPGAREAFVALPAGGALVVMSSDPPASTTVWVITGDGVLEAGIPVAGLGDVALFPGTEGAPVLWTGSRWLRWAPWSGTFQPVSNGPAAGPREGVGAAPDGGLVVWLSDDLDQGMHVWGFRHGARGPYQSTPRALLSDGPAYVTPDRLPGESARYDDRKKGLVLANGATALVADATFARVSVDVESPSGGAPLVVLRDDLDAEVVVGGPSCPLVIGSRIHVERDREVVRASVDRGPLVTCATRLPRDARVSVAVRSGPSPAFVTSLTVTRVP